ncbi:precorrin-6y C5,15-methyltransferase (decarboxylating) subunit CbiE [Treponema pedis]|uniref:precorrin-6y C5,15-methyltransferase (decarboxylating) subunit CbiE n=1 Tax=Treponema pedis TaxID=409322 RepID=UPI0003F62E8E|nr:precorrin-6y C5,15-methyltransferase (decarboxylating) subunit CbiE [Treponema pedis]
MGLIIAGAGPGNIRLLTGEVLEEIKNADIVASFERIADDLKTIKSGVLKLKSLTDIIDLPFGEKRVLVLASGDPCFFGITAYLKTKNINMEKVLTGISSMQYFMCKLQKQWHSLKFYSLHGRSADFTQMKNDKAFFILTDKTNNPDFISQELKRNTFFGKIYVGYNLSYEDECVEVYNIGEKIKVKSFLNTVMVENEKY